MDKRQISHDILNLIERLRIMHDLVKEENFEVISKEEIKVDLDEALKLLNENFQKLL